MYGLIHNSARALVINEFGADAWDRVADEAGLSDDDFLALKSYDDSVLLRLLSAVVHISNTPLQDLLHRFGMHFVENTAYSHYAGVMNMHGRTLWDVLANLNHMHDRMTSTFPAYRPPTFTLLTQENGSHELIYTSERQGLTGFVHGLIDGLASHFETPLTVTVLEQNCDEAGQTTRFLLQAENIDD